MALVKISKSVEKILEKVMGKGAKAAANTAEEAVKVAAHNGRRLGKVFVGAKKITLKEAKQRIQAGDFLGRAKKANASKRASKTVNKVPIQKNEVTTYRDFVNRSVVGDNLEGHEVLQHANLKANGLVTERLSTEASKNNPVIALDKATHKEVNKAQRAFDAAKQTPEANIKANAEILRKAGIPEEKVKDITNKALEHAKNLQKQE